MHFVIIVYDFCYAGHGWKRAVLDWYLSKDALKLAEIVTKHRRHFKFSHKDLFKLTHIKSSDPGMYPEILFA